VNDERIIEYLRARGRADVPAGFVGSVMRAVDDAPIPRSMFSPYLPAVAAAGVVAVIAVLALWLGQGRDVGPAPNPSATAAPVSLDELRAAVTESTVRLADSPGVQGVQTAWIEEYLASASWFDWRPNGDQVVVRRSDTDVQAPWWTDPEGEPLTVGERIETEMNVFLGDSWYRTEAGSWVVAERTDAPRGPLVYAIGLLTGEIPAVPPTEEAAETIATRRDLDDGGQVWVLELSDGEGTWVAEWHIGPDGLLVSFATEGVGVTMFPSEDFGTATQRTRVEFTTLAAPEPIAAPDPDATPDPAVFGLPADFPLADGGRAADVDYRAYVDVAMDALEAYHWNAASIDWEAARAAALGGLPEDPTADQAHQRIRNAIQTFDFFSTVFVRPEDVPTGSGPPVSLPGPSGTRLGDVGYLHLPALDAGGPEDVRGYLQDGRTAMESIESTAPACGWIVDVRETAFGAYPPLFGVLAGLLGDGRVITFDSTLGDWWVEVNGDGTLLIDGEERTADILDSPAVAEATPEDERLALEFADILASEAAHQPRDPDAPVVVLTSNVTAAAGEQLVVGFRGRPATRVMGGVTAGSPHGQMSLEMVDGARLRIPVSTLVDRDGTVYDSNLVPDESVAVIGGPDGDDPAIDAALEWLESQPGCS
jgi:hypothetical protein